ncbi:MAG: hypothetical protein R2780_10935 [Crocinitomicaceae bacterium]|nr:hypothetical protein [Crocinitomicaceae bacterium]
MEGSMDEILDSEKNDSTVLRIFQWWEKKRIIYNLILGLAGLISMLMISPGFTGFELFGIVMWGLFANLCYSIGFLIEMANLYYLKGRYDLSSVRMAFFLFGTGFAGFCTFFFPFLVYFPFMI